MCYVEYSVSFLSSYFFHRIYQSNQSNQTLIIVEISFETLKTSEFLRKVSQLNSERVRY